VTWRTLRVRLASYNFYGDTGIPGSRTGEVNVPEAAGTGQDTSLGIGVRCGIGVRTGIGGWRWEVDVELDFSTCKSHKCNGVI